MSKKREIALTTAYMSAIMGGGNAYDYWDGYTLKTYPQWNYHRFGKKSRKPNRKRR